MLDPGFAVACRSCGAPSAPAADRCTYCGAREQYDAATQARLVAHRARMRRSLQQLRAVVTSQVSAALISGKAAWMAGLFFVLPIGGILAGMLGPFALVLLLKPRGALAALGMLAGVAGGGLGLAAGLAIFYQGMKRYAAVSRRQARDIVLGIEVTTPVVCPGCGGHAVVVALGPDEPCPCPWCAASLLPSGSADAAAQAAAQAMLVHHEAAAHRLMRDVQRRHRRPRKAPPLAGFEVVGGTVVKGATAGVPLRAFNELFEGVFFFRLEVPLETGIDGEVFLVRPEVERDMRNMTHEWGYALPEQVSASPREGWLAYADGASVPACPALGGTLDKLGPSDALLLDPAGLSLWRKGLGLSYAWGLLREHHETLSALARALHPEAANGPRGPQSAVPVGRG